MTKEERSYNGVKTVYSVNGAGKIRYMQKNETTQLSYTISSYTSIKAKISQNSRFSFLEMFNLKGLSLQKLFWDHLRRRENYNKPAMTPITTCYKQFWKDILREILAIWVK